MLSEKGEIRRVCANPECLIHHARKPKPVTDAAIKAGMWFPLSDISYSICIFVWKIMR
jgi:hypothetical protein